tara:strand:+ start:190 stop:564 length:375 start_codon:yes stop_codon:yes gene_type:complete
MLGYALEWKFGLVKNTTHQKDEFDTSQNPEMIISYWSHESIPQPTEEECAELLIEYAPVHAMKLLRIERDRLLTKTDWQATSDRVMTADQTEYRKALRDLPSTASPELDGNGDLTGVTWPTKPE